MSSGATVHVARSAREELRLMARAARDAGDIIRTPRVAFLTSAPDVFVHVRRRVEHGGNAGFVIAEQIGEFGDAFRLKAFKNESHNIRGC